MIDAREHIDQSAFPERFALLNDFLPEPWRPNLYIVLTRLTSLLLLLLAAVLVTEAAGFGIASVTSDSAHSSLTVSHTQVEGGSRIGFFDVGIAALVQGSAARAQLDVFDSQVWGRLSRSGRNIMVVASGGASAVTRVERSLSGATGQDGIVAAVMQSPSEITLYVHDSTIEDAGQMNIEGTLVNLKSANPSRINEGRVTSSSTTVMLTL